jgi:hypothetical protein
MKELIIEVITTMGFKASIKDLPDAYLLSITNSTDLPLFQCHTMKTHDPNMEIIFDSVLYFFGTSAQGQT